MRTIREWVTIEDPVEDREWVLDVTFLASGWRCVFGECCQGVLTEPTPELVQGCCSYGAHFTDDEDVARVVAVAATLTDDQWQFAKQGRKRGVVKRNQAGDTVSRLVDDACIFLNRPDFPGGPGCALHRAAVERGVPHHELKPDVCWQLPLRRVDEVDEDKDGRVTSTIMQWDREHWGAGGDEFAWWCTEAPEAFTGSSAVYVSMKDELVAMMGPAVYDLLRVYMEGRMAGRVPLPHPARKPT